MKTYFLDFEASSLDAESYPIEIAWVDQNGNDESYLIRPEPTWTDWSSQSEAIHGIPQARLYAEGQPAAQVAKRAVAVLSGCCLVSDNPAYDAEWLALLVGLVGAQEAIADMIDFSDLIRSEIRRLFTLIPAALGSVEFWHQRRALLREGETLAVRTIAAQRLEQRVQHRASADAQQLWIDWTAVREAISQRLAV